MFLLASLLVIATILAWSPVRRIGGSESVVALVVVGLTVVVLFQFERLA